MGQKINVTWYKSIEIFLILAGAWALCFALYFEIINGYEPCHLCLLQRIPYVILMAMGLVGILRPRHILFWAGLTIAVLMFSSLLALYHIGVEQHWWASVVVCENVLVTDISTEELVHSLLTNSAPACDRVDWSLFGASMATYNLIYSAGLVAIWCFWFKNLKDKGFG